MVSTVPKPQVAATCSTLSCVLSTSRRRLQPEGFDVFGGADAHLGLEPPAEVPLGQVGKRRELGDAQVLGEVLGKPRQQVLDWLGVGVLGGEQGRVLRLATGSTNASAREAAPLRDFADKPLIVLTAGSGHDATWMAAQNQLATLSTSSAHRVVAGATHAGLVAEEGPAAATTQAVLDVVSAVRDQGPVRQ